MSALMTAARARYMTFATGGSRRFVDFAVDAFASACGAHDMLWMKHFDGTGFDSRPNDFRELAAEILLSRTVDKRN